jgi:CHAT domain-containing protein
MRYALSIALIAEKNAHDGNLGVIHGVDKEAEDIELLARSSRVGKVHRVSSPTTISWTCEAMQSANVVHLACHGIQDGLHATQSGFCLGDGRLTISQLMDLKMEKAFLAFLSACDTASGDKEHPDQAMHLAAAMLFTGFRTVVATMWYVDSLQHSLSCAHFEQGDQRCRWAKGSEVVLPGTLCKRGD